MNHTREPQYSHNPCQPASLHQHASNKAQTTALLHARLLPTLAVLVCSSQTAPASRKSCSCLSPNSPLTGLPQLPQCLPQCPGLRQLAALCLLAGMHCTVQPSRSGATTDPAGATSERLAPEILQPIRPLTDLPPLLRQRSVRRLAGVQVENVSALQLRVGSCIQYC